jgi:uncharacterized membrane protein YphA (DoxX/SURF4 family)
VPVEATAYDLFSTTHKEQMTMSQRKSKLVTATRIGLGLIFFVFGLDGFLHFVPQPAPTGNAAIFFTGLVASGYFLPLLKVVELVAGFALLMNRFVPLALTVLAPIVVNIVAFHLALAPSGLPIAALVLAAELTLAWAHRAAFAPMLWVRTEATTSSPVSPADARRRVAA